MYSVLSPEGFASILWKDRSRAAEAASVMKMGADQVCQMGIVAVISEGEKPAHENPDEAAANVKRFIAIQLARLSKLSAEELVADRHSRFARF